MSGIPEVNAIEDLWLRLDQQAQEYYQKQSAQWARRIPWDKLSESTKSVWRKAIVTKTGFELKLEI